MGGRARGRGGRARVGDWGDAPQLRWGGPCEARASADGLPGGIDVGVAAHSPLEKPPRLRTDLCLRNRGLWTDQRADPTVPRAPRLPRRRIASRPRARVPPFALAASSRSAAHRRQRFRIGACSSASFVARRRGTLRNPIPVADRRGASDERGGPRWSEVARGGPSGRRGWWRELVRGARPALVPSPPPLAPRGAGASLRGRRLGALVLIRLFLARSPRVVASPLRVVCLMR